MIKTVIFDIGNVLLHFSWREHFASFGYSSEIQEKLANATVLSNDWQETDLGILSYEEIFQLFVENDPSIEKEIRESLTNIGGMLSQYDYAIPWIQDLKSRGYQVLFLSNFSEKALLEGAADMTFLPYMDGGVFSYKVNLVKPDPAIYKLLLEKYRLQPEECVFLDDTLPNVEAANALGIHGIHFQNREQAQKELENMLVRP